MAASIHLSARLVFAAAILTVGWLSLFVVTWALLWANTRTRQNVRD